MSNAFNLATGTDFPLYIPNPTYLRIGGGTIGQVLTSAGPSGVVAWAAGGGGGGGPILTDGTSITGDGVVTALAAALINAGTF